MQTKTTGQTKPAKFNDRFGRAMRVMKLLRVPATWTAEDYTVTPYLNGRERGLLLEVWTEGSMEKPRFVIWSEFRNTDEMVVYRGVGKNFESKLTEEAYAAKKFFGGDTEADAEKAAAAYISAKLAELSTGRGK